VKRAALVLAAGLALAVAGCGGGGEPRTVTVTKTVPAPAAPAPSASVADVVARVLPSVVSVRTTTFGGDTGEGSGVVVARDGVIVTNYHVVENAQSVTVTVSDGKHPQPLAGEVVGTSPEHDLAVIRVAARNLVPVRIGQSAKLRLGDEVLALGYPLELGGPTVTRGIVSGTNRTFEPEEGPALAGLLQTDAAINPGNSGGALVDAQGRLVGINTAGVQAGAAENVGFAIPTAEALPVIREIRNVPRDSQAWLGVTLASVDSASAAAQLGLPADVRGAVVVGIYPTGPAVAAGLKEGDVIIAADGEPVRSAGDLTRKVAAGDPGDRLELEVVDIAGPRRADARLARRPRNLPGG
jgi:serine protease Do